MENNIAAGKDYQKTKTDYLNTLSKYQSLKSMLHMLNLNPDDVLNGQINNKIKITAPINGYITSINIKIGTYANNNLKMFEISNKDSIHADFQIFEKDLHLIKTGNTILFTTTNNPNKEYTAKIFAIEQKINPKNRSVTIHSKIYGNKENLMQGMFINGQLLSNKKLVKTLPNKAIANDGDKHFIFITEKHEHKHEHKLHLKAIEILTGTTQNGYTEIIPLNNLPNNTNIALNAAYFLLSELKKSELEHHH